MGPDELLHHFSCVKLGGFAAVDRHHLDFMFEGFFKTNYEKVKTLFNFILRGLKYFCCRTKCYFAQCLPLNMTVSAPIVVL